jgi:hypothetical protein
MRGWDTRGSFKESGSIQTDSPSSSIAGVDGTRTPSHQASQRLVLWYLMVVITILSQGT